MTRPSFIIREARESDVPDILAMIRELAAFENLADEIEVTANSLHEGLFGTPPAAAALIAVVGTEVVGYALFYKTFSSFTGCKGLFLDDIFVRPGWRNQGIGRALLESVAKIGQGIACKRFEWIALRWNANALKFYNELGAKILDDWVMLRMDRTGMNQLLKREQERAFN